MVIALAGYGGFIGHHLRRELVNHEFVFLSRKDLYGSATDLAKKITGADVVINVAGFSVSQRWTKANRQKIYFSRVNVTDNITEAIKLCNPKPKNFINASAIGIYEHGKSHNEEEFTKHDDFLADVVEAWEKAADKASGHTKVAVVRLGMVLGRDGGAFPRLFKLFRWGLGAVMGSGKQVYSFIHVKDVAEAISFLIDNNREGVYNLTAPHPVTNKKFTKTMANYAERRTIFSIPAFAMKLMMGQAASIVLEGQTVYPKKLLEEGFKFNFATIDETIENIVKQQ